jgi:hypothetical protein
MKKNEQVLAGVAAGVVCLWAFRKHQQAKEVSKLDWHKLFAGSNSMHK